MARQQREEYTAPVCEVLRFEVVEAITGSTTTPVSEVSEGTEPGDEASDDF